MKRRDLVYYVGWFTLLILLGVWMLLWALGTLKFGEAILLWLLSASMLLVVIGGISGRRPASNVQLGAGLVLCVFVLIMLGIVSDVLGGFVGAAVGIILIGIIGLLLLFRNIKLEA
ncbi:MAG: hypothetical protein KKH41_04725 [Candidatus Thermoplasmatota archaeon]|nr:hypothetical protein [Euryarchaeota archaeon]MBU4032360.1 hypothetical protein [Candidatus Thermoplasmatota archaeon]MBU4071867.1 hypothetical protein [Candidatus Thermoplasmatota archaeon]MBU4144014.1 hypothetical protein [Candidatus Thermoplasmatota archaeon]MBU4591872.1 hypothetical protein [Candidatus Thermoplasmatota archaeon]